MLDGVRVHDARPGHSRRVFLEFIINKLEKVKLPEKYRKPKRCLCAKFPGLNSNTFGKQKFLQSVIDRRWTRSPDSLEKTRGTWRFNFVAVDAPHSGADGRVMLYPIDGIGSEVALMAYLPQDGFLWASDYIQTLEKPSLYTKELWNAVQRNHVEPGRVAAEHLPITGWETVTALVGK